MAHWLPMDANTVIPNSRKPQFPEETDYEVFVPRQAFSRDPSGKRKVRLVAREWLIRPPAPVVTEMEKMNQDDSKEPGLHSFIRLVNDNRTCEELSVKQETDKAVEEPEQEVEEGEEEFGVFSLLRHRVNEESNDTVGVDNV